MVGEGLWRPLIGNLNDPKSQDQALATLRSLLEREGENAAAIAVMLAALIVQDVNTPRGKELALAFAIRARFVVLVTLTGVPFIFHINSVCTSASPSGSK